MTEIKKNPYTGNGNRLADVIAAIQVMATYKFYKLDFAGWADRIEGQEEKGEYWKRVFEEHPEFFRLDRKRERASLVWRRNYQKLYDVDREVKITREAFQAMDDEAKARISRVPLMSADISTLMNTAIDLHSREIEYKKDARWWISGVVGLSGVIVGAVLQAYGG